MKTIMIGITVLINVLDQFGSIVPFDWKTIMIGINYNSPKSDWFQDDIQIHHFEDCSVKNEDHFVSPDLCPRRGQWQ